MFEHVLIDEFEAHHSVTLDRGRMVARMREAFLSDLSAVCEIKVFTNTVRRAKGLFADGRRLGRAPAAIVVPSLRATGLAPLFGRRRGS